MSGRAGRRGKDERGICIIMVDEQVNIMSSICKINSCITLSSIHYINTPSACFLFLNFLCT